MKYFRIFINLLILSLIITSCGELIKPNIEFEKPIRGKTINLAKKVGDSFQIIRDGNTLDYSIIFDKANDFNYLIKSNSDTIFSGTVTKRKEFYLLNRKLENGKYAIHALKFTDTDVTGLETEWQQSNIINDEINNGNFTNLVVDTLGTKSIRANKKQAKELFRFVIEQLESEELVTE